jgi:ATP-binding cassette subfamily B multidrug efflux pump
MDRIVVIEEGKIIEEGTHNQLLKKNGTYAKLWKIQSTDFIADENL